MKENATLIIDQTACAVNHPNGLDVDNIGGAFRKNDKSRFYEIKKQDDWKLSISSEVNAKNNPTIFRPIQHSLKRN